MQERTAIVGAGRMGEALLAGLLRAGRPADSVVVSERYRDRAVAIEQRYGVTAVPPREAVSADTVLVAVKPQELSALLDEVAGAVPADTLVVSILAGVPTAAFEQRLAARAPVVRVMSNTPALVGEAMSVVAAGAHADESHLARAEELLRPVGRVLRVPEAQLDAVTALSGSGPAYLFLVVEALTDAGVLLGLPRAVASELVVQTAVGAAALLRDGEHPALLRDAVSSPGGTTIAALRELEERGVRAAMYAAAQAAADRSRALASSGE